MKIVSVNKKQLDKYCQDPEFLHKSKRPCVLVVRLKYKDRRYNFAIPFRSNIPAASPKDEYFPLPTRPTTKPGNRHGLHYIKMFPITNDKLQIYHTEGNAAATLYKKIIDDNQKRIVLECQKYLDKYESGDKPKFATDIDLLITLM